MAEGGSGTAAVDGPAAELLLLLLEPLGAAAAAAAAAAAGGAASIHAAVHRRLDAPERADPVVDARLHGQVVRAVVAEGRRCGQRCRCCGSASVSEHGKRERAASGACWLDSQTTVGRTCCDSH